MTFRRAFLFLLVLGLALTGFMYWTATRDPVVRETAVGLPGWPRGEPAVRAVLISDIHVAGPDMPPSRLERIVGQINALQPDLVLIAGDFVGDKDVGTRTYSAEQIAAPLGQLRPRLGTFAVLGNHDHWRAASAIRTALERDRVRVLDNEAARAGPLAIGGLDDDFIGQDDMPTTLAAMRRLPGIRVLLSHSPDPFATLADDVALMLAGHTHCGQIRLPIIGAISYESRYGDRYGCGRIDERGRTLIVGAGLGTSILPLRLGAVPDLWVVTIGPERRSTAVR
jgi:predicted MPP superfamily phosphohydrolase